jgi:hypothetical protein
MTITLPDEMREVLERNAKAAGFATVAEYVADLIHADESLASLPEPPPGARYAVNTREELEAKLLEGMDRSGDVVAGPDFWEQRRLAAEQRE